MISLEQIRLLETKINKAVELIKVLRQENRALKGTLNSSQDRMQELEKLVGDFKTDQNEIEQSILRALKKLDHLEDEITETKNEKSAKNSSEEKPKDSSDLPFEPIQEPSKGIKGGKEKELEIF